VGLRIAPGGGDFVQPDDENPTDTTVRNTSCSRDEFISSAASSQPLWTVKAEKEKLRRPIMNDHQIVDSSFTAIVNAPLDKIDIPAWCFNLSEREYQACSPAHVAAGFTMAPEGKRMSINVEIIGGSLMVQHYVETLAQRDHLILDSTSDVFTPSGRTTIHVTWELSVRDLGAGRCEFTNRVRSHPTEEFMTFLERQGIPFEQFRAQRQPASIAHNQAETPLFAASIERAARAN
jgi:hypothetical protein